MKLRVLLVCFALVFVACTESAEGDEDAPIGSLNVMLKGTDSAGVSYWLRDAQFVIDGWPDYPYPPGMGKYVSSASGAPGYPGPMGSGYHHEFSSEDYPDDTEINLRLVPGQYNVTLVNNDWYLERGTDADRERVEKVVMLTPQSQYVYVWDGGAANVGLRFGVDGELIDFRSGTLRIVVEIEKPGDHCSPGGYAGYGGYGGFGPISCGAAGSAGAEVGGWAGSAGAPAPLPQ